MRVLYTYSVRPPAEFFSNKLSIFQVAKISSIPRTPPPVEGRLHIDMQTDDMLEELTDKPLELSADTQTDAIMDRPASPLFVPAKSGIDVDTQVIVGDLFDFDLEVIRGTKRRIGDIKKRGGNSVSNDHVGSGSSNRTAWRQNGLCALSLCSHA